jgi:MoaA/NifB/PqqE/SkfB family radical SAM enzyme
MEKTLYLLKKGDIEVGSLTNGSKLKGFLARALADCAKWVRISIDGWDNESYSKYRGVKLGEFEKVLDNIGAFAALTGGCYIGASIIVDRENHEHVFELANKLVYRGVVGVKISPCILGTAEENDRHHAKIEKRVREEIEKTRGLGIDVYDGYHAQLGEFKKDYTSCYMAQLLTVVGADCNVYYCQDKAYDKRGVLGSIKDRRFIDLWNDKHEDLRKINPSLECNHHCVADPKNRLLHGFFAVTHTDFI